MIHIGMDEANYSPSLAGPCVVSAYVAEALPKSVKDSKAVKEKRRLKLFAQLEAKGYYNITLAMPSDIEKFGIHSARTRIAIESLKRALDSLSPEQRLSKIKIHVDLSLRDVLEKHPIASQQNITIIGTKGGDS